MSVPFEREAELALRAVSSGGDLARQGPEGQPIWVKDTARDIATEMDERIEMHIRGILDPAGHPILGEETVPTLGPEALDGTFWAVDPIDGTVNWVSGLPYYAVSVGLVVDRRCAVGAVSAPASRELYFTHGDGTAFLNGRVLRPGRPHDLAEALVAVSHGSSRGGGPSRPRQFAFMAEVDGRSRGCLRLGSAALNICQVAAGRMSAAYGCQAFAWDVAGALAVAAHAGNTVYLGWQPGSVRVDYVVGRPGVAEELRDLGVEAGFLVLGGQR